jgi:hypothetical protein
MTNPNKTTAKANISVRYRPGVTYIGRIATATGALKGQYWENGMSKTRNEPADYRVQHINPYAFGNQMPSKYPTRGSSGKYLIADQPQHKRNYSRDTEYDCVTDSKAIRFSCFSQPQYTSSQQQSHTNISCYSRQSKKQANK